MSDTLVYTSKSSVKSLWQEYRIYEDRLEFSTLFGQLTIPFEQVESVEVSESDLKGLLKGDLKLKGFRPALKLDWANFVEHVVLDRARALFVACFSPLMTPKHSRAPLTRLSLGSARARAQPLTEVRVVPNLALKPTGAAILVSRDARVL